MKRFVFVIPLALGVLGLVSGCSSDDGGDAPASIDRESFPAKAAQAFCENVTDCCDEAGIDQDMDTCLSNAEESFEDVLAANDWLEMKYDGTRAPACIDAYTTTMAKCGKVTLEDAEAFLATCAELFQGTLAAGEECHEDSECAGDFADCKKADPDDATGVCVALKPRAHAKSGGDCAATCSGSSLFPCTYDPDDAEPDTDGCYLSDKLWCNEGNCEALGEVGDACDFYGCGAGLFCDGGACAQQRKEGQPCDAADFDACEEGTLCNGEECVGLHAAGAVCTIDEECESGTCRNDVCAINNATEAACSGLDVN